MTRRNKYLKTESAKREYRYLLLVLKCLGIDIFESNIRWNLCSRIFKFLMPVFFNIIFIERTANVIIMIIIKPDALKLYLSFLVKYVLNIVLWFIVYYKKKEIRKLLSKLHERFDIVLMSEYRQRKCHYLYISRFITLLICLLPIIFGVASTITQLRSPNFRLYIWKADKNSFGVIVFLFLRAVSVSLQRDTFCGAVCLIYSLVCWRTTLCLLHYRKLFEKLLSDKEFMLVSENIFSRYILILNSTEDIDICFSFPIFVVTLINGVGLFSLLIYSFLNPEITPYTILRIIVIFITCTLFLLVTVFLSSQVPLEIKTNVNVLCRLHEEITQNPPNFPIDHHQIKLLRAITKRPIIILTGCDIIYFNRNVILVILGTLFTYGLLIINLK